ncbi:hypothetical protein BDQ17DRAFT_1545058 [Cyathus striatus]|nr:hypothetical protein BDQ17DRAFT_1545058 [Cyathus striatus]
MKHSESSGTRLKDIASPPAVLDDHCDTQIVNFNIHSRTHFEACVEHHPSDKIDYPDNALVATRMQGTECILAASVKRKILNTTYFPNDLPPTNSTPIYELKDTGSSMGLGMFAARNFTLGDLILVEQPILIVPEKVDLTGIRDFAALLPADLLSSYTSFGRLNEENKKAFLQLSNAYSTDGSGGDRLSAIAETHGFHITQASDMDDFLDSIKSPEKEKDNYLSSYCYITKEISRINHSCVPNSAIVFDVASFAVYLRAGKNIRRGEQIFINYGSPVSQTSARRKASLLARYQFDCTCPICSLSPPDLAACDKLCTSLSSRISAAWNRRFPNGDWMLMLNPSTGHPVNNEIQGILNDMERWGMEVSGCYANTLRDSSSYYEEMSKKSSTFYLVLKGEMDCDMMKNTIIF